jgi:hypothetical protein
MIIKKEFGVSKLPFCPTRTLRAQKKVTLAQNILLGWLSTFIVVDCGEIASNGSNNAG